MKLETIIGLEIHVQLKTTSKMFCGCSNDGEHQPPNTTVCPICLGHPGTLPVPNNLAVRWSVKAARALGCTINTIAKFDRKNYFYPDIPKGYQISQFDQPMGEHGFLDIDVEGEERKIGITRLHLEEDTAKLTHTADHEYSLVDFNRSGTPLVEIVTEPDIRTPAEAKVFMEELRLLMRHLGVSDADMEKGHLRCDANISLRPVGEDKMYAKTELKNINSFKFVERGLAYEVKRQTALWEQGSPPEVTTTRGWDENKAATFEQRTKEDSADYRYFPEPDIPPLTFDEEYLRDVELELPELPRDKRARFVEQYGIAPDEAKVITDASDLADYTEQVISELRAWLDAYEEIPGTGVEIWEEKKQELGKLVSGWLVSKLGGKLQERKQGFGDNPLSAEDFAQFLSMVFTGKLSSRMAQGVLDSMLETGDSPAVIVEREGLEQVSDSAALEEIAARLVAENEKQAEEYRGGKEAVLKFFVGQMMRETKGAADPKVAEEVLKKALK